MTHPVHLKSWEILHDFPPKENTGAGRGKGSTGRGRGSLGFGIFGFALQGKVEEMKLYIYIIYILLYIYIQAGDTPQKWDMKNMNGIWTDTTNQLYDICFCLKIRSTSKLQQFWQF